MNEFVRSTVLIMAGGAGTRFWPESRLAKPKQFLDFLGTGKSLLQATFERAKLLTTVRNIYIATGCDYVDLVLEHIPEILPQNIIVEPSRNNTGPCIAYACWKLVEKGFFGSLVILPSDHYIAYESKFIASLQRAVDFADANKAIVTLGITPTSPNTGYGYIKKSTQLVDGVYSVEGFYEKPDLEKAKHYVNQGSFFWNAGVFIANVLVLKQAFERYASEIATVFNQGLTLYNTVKETDFINQYYARCPNISVDYAILEQHHFVCTIPTDCGWSDLGTWTSLYALAPKDEHRNFIRAQNVLLDDVSGSAIIAENENKKLIISGLHDFLVIDQEDVLLIYPKNQEQNIKQITAQLKDMGDERYL